MSVQFGRKLPLWYQACEAIRADIYERVASNELRLPTESQIAEQHQVSVITVRQALAALEEEGLITRVRRRGTLINPAAVKPRDLRVLGSHSAVLHQQFPEGPKLLEKARISTPSEVKRLFNGAPEVTHMRRLRFVDGEPVNYCVNYILPEFGERITEDDLTRYPLPRILRDICKVRITRVDYVVRAQGATPMLAEQLNIKVKSPVLFFTSTVYDKDEQVIEHGQIYYRPESFSFDVSIDMD